MVSSSISCLFERRSRVVRRPCATYSVASPRVQQLFRLRGPPERASAPRRSVPFPDRSVPLPGRCRPFGAVSGPLRAAPVRYGPLRAAPVRSGSLGAEWPHSGPRVPPGAAVHRHQRPRRPRGPRGALVRRGRRALRPAPGVARNRGASLVDRDERGSDCYIWKGRRPGIRAARCFPDHGALPCASLPARLLAERRAGDRIVGGLERKAGR